MRPLCNVSNYVPLTARVFVVSILLISTLGSCKNDHVAGVRAIGRIPADWYADKPSRGLLVAADERSDRIKLIGRLTRNKGFLKSKGSWESLESSLDPSGRWFTFIGPQGSLYIHNIQRGKEIRLIEPKRGWNIRAIRWLSGRRMLVMASKPEPFRGPGSKRIPNFKPRTQIFELDVRSRAIGPPLIDVAETASLWSAGDQIQGLWPFYLQSSRDRVVGFTEGTLHILDRASGVRKDLRLDDYDAPDNDYLYTKLPAVSPDGRLVAYKNGRGIFLRKIDDRAFRRQIMSVKYSDTPAMVWPDDHTLIIANQEYRALGTRKSRVILTTFRVDNIGNLHKERREVRFVDWLIPYLPQRISPDSQGLAIGVIGTSKSQLEIYSHKQRGFIRFPLGFDAKSPVELLGWSKNWDD